MKPPQPQYRRIRAAPYAVRLVIGALLILGGLFGFLPVLGFWMVPLGLFIMFFHVSWVRRQWLRVRLWLKNRRIARGN